jgi:hypothetical protein
VFEQDDGIITFLFEIESNLGADPFFRAVDHLPQYSLAGFKIDDLHLEAAEKLAVFMEQEFDRAAEFAFALRVVGPPSGQTVSRGERLVNLIDGRFDTDSMQNIEHTISPFTLIEDDDVVMARSLGAKREGVGVTSVTGFRWIR